MQAHDRARYAKPSRRRPPSPTEGAAGANQTWTITIGQSDWSRAATFATFVRTLSQRVAPENSHSRGHLVLGKAAFWHLDPNAALLRRVEP